MPIEFAGPNFRLFKNPWFAERHLRDHFLLRVRGTSMMLDGINDGDLAIVRHTRVAKAGDIVVAVVDGGDVTLKRFKKKKIRLP